MMNPAIDSPKEIEDWVAASSPKPGSVR
jgi:hypothetical protein